MGGSWAPVHGHDSKEGMKMNLKKLNVLLLLSILLLAPTIYIALSQPSNTFYISSGIYPHGVSYTVFKESSTYYAKNAYGKIVISETDATTVFQYVIDSLNSGGKIFVKSAIYSIETSIEIKYSYISIIGESPYTTTLKLADNANCDIFNFSGNWGHSRFSSFELDGNKDNNVAGSAFKARGYEGIYYDLQIHDFDSHGFILEATGGANNRFLYVDCYNNDGSGFYIRHGDTRFTVCRSYSNVLHGFDLEGTTQYIYDCSIFSNNKSGIYADGTGFLQIQGSNIGANDEHGIILKAWSSGIYAFRIVDNVFRENSYTVHNTSDAIHLQGLGAPYVEAGLILGNSISGDDEHRYGIYLGSGVRNILIENNDFLACAVNNATYIDGATSITIQDNLE